MAQYDVSDVANYLECYMVTPAEMFSRYLGVMTEFVTQAVDTVSISNIDYFKHIMVKGMENITHVFRMILLYTRNLDVAVYNSKKSVYYFIEFIGQIGDDSHEYLKLSSTDATLFVYKKTIFALSQARRKEHSDSDEENAMVTKCFFHMTELWLSAMRQAISQRVKIRNDEAMTALDEVRSYAAAILGLVPRRISLETASQRLESMLAFSDAVKALSNTVNIELLEAMCKRVEKESLATELIGKAVVDNADKLTTTSVKKFATLIAAESAKHTEQASS